MKDSKAMFHYDHYLLVTHQEFHLVSQQEVSRMTKVPTATPPGPTTPMTPLTSHTSGSKKRQLVLSQHDDP